MSCTAPGQHRREHPCSSGTGISAPRRGSRWTHGDWDPKGLGQPRRGSLEVELCRHVTITAFTQLGLHPFASSEAEAQQRWDGFAKAARGHTEWLGELVSPCE